MNQSDTWHVQQINRLRREVDDLLTREQGAYANPPGTPFNLNRIFHFPSSQVLPTQWTKTAANLQAALAACASGEIVQVHGPCTLAGDFTVPAGAVLTSLDRHNIVLQGTVYLEDGAAVLRVGIEKTANDATNIYGVVGPTTGTGYVLECDVVSTQSGAGNSYAVGAIRGIALNNGNVWIDENCYLNGISVGGSGYGTRSIAGLIKAWTGKCYGSTGRHINA